MILEVWADTLGHARCRSCDAPIVWIEIVKSGKRMCFNADPVPVGTKVNPEDRRHIFVMDTEVSPTHWETCPDAAKWKRGR